MRKNWSGEDGSGCGMKKNPLNNRFRIGLFNDGKWASIETDTAEEMMSALELLNVKRKVKEG